MLKPSWKSRGWRTVFFVSGLLGVLVVGSNWNSATRSESGKQTGTVVRSRPTLVGVGEQIGLETARQDDDATELPAVQAELAFRAGEALRARGDSGGARAAFLRAFATGEGTLFRTRAQLELGHLNRRSEAWSSALDHYFALSHDDHARREDRDAALYWQGVVWCELQNFDAAKRTWRLLAHNAQRALDRVRAFDRMARIEFNTGNQKAARAVLAACDEALNPVAAELTTLGASVRGALARMWSRRALATNRSIEIE